MHSSFDIKELLNGNRSELLI